MEYVLRLFVHHGITELTVVTRKGDKSIQNYFGDGSRVNADIDYFVQRSARMGTGGVVSAALRHMKSRDGSTVVIYYGDILSDIDLGELVRAHEGKKADTTLALSGAYRLKAAVPVIGSGGTVSKLLVRPDINEALPGGPRKHVAMGILVMSARTCDALALHKENAFDLMRDFIPFQLSKGDTVAAYIHRGYWLDIGTPENFLTLEGSSISDRFSFLGDSGS